MDPKTPTPDPKPLDPFSPLYCRLNGFMCGTALLVAGIAQDDLYNHRIERINSFLREVQIPLQLPAKKAALDKELKRVMQVIGDQLALKAQELGDFYALALFMLNLPEDETNLNTQIVKELDRIQRQYELPEKAVKEFRRARNQARDQRGLAALLNPAMELLRRLIDPLDLESDTCFVSMPFQEEFEMRWGTFYWPLISVTNNRALRAWGNIGGEDYQSLMWETINKCGSLIADASGNGPNVLSEVGYAMGAKKMVMVMKAEDSPGAVANIHPDWIYIYSIVEGADPPESTIEQALHWYGAVKSAHEAGISMMDPYTAPGKILDFLDEAAKKKDKTFFRWKGHSKDRDRN